MESLLLYPTYSSKYDNNCSAYTIQLLRCDATDSRRLSNCNFYGKLVFDLCEVWIRKPHPIHLLYQPENCILLNNQ